MGNGQIKKDLYNAIEKNKYDEAFKILTENPKIAHECNDDDQMKLHHLFPIQTCARMGFSIMSDPMFSLRRSPQVVEEIIINSAHYKIAVLLLEKYKVNA